MRTPEVSVGLDYHQHTVQVCVPTAEGNQLLNRICRNDAEEFLEAVQGGGHSVFAALEACSGAADLADELILQGGRSISLTPAKLLASSRAQTREIIRTHACWRI
jgi:hypothetical protein